MIHEIGWLAIAFACGALALRLHLPLLVGYLLAGVGLGIAGATPSPLLEGVSHAGVILLLFGVGLHLRIRNILNRAVLAGGGTHLLISCVLFMLVAVPFGVPAPTAAFLGLILSFSSTVLAAKDLENRQEMGAYYGRIAIGILLLQDVVALLLILLISDEIPSPWALALPLILLLRPTLYRLAKHIQDDTQMLVFAALMALGGGAVFELTGLHAELGALLMGAFFADHHRADEIQRRLWGLKEFFLIGFFLNVGMIAVPHPALWTEMAGLAILILLVLPFKAGLFFFLLTAFGLRVRTAFLTGAILTSYSEFTLMAGLIGLQNQLISSHMFSILTIATAASFAINLPLNRLVNAIYLAARPHLARFQRPGLHPDRPLHSIGRASHIVVGMGRTGTAAFDRLQARGQRPIGLESDPVVIARHLKAGRRVVFGDALDPELWDEIQIQDLRGVVIAVPNLTARLRTAKRLKWRRPELRVATYALHDYEIPLLEQLQVDEVHHILNDVGMRLTDSLL